MNRKKLFYRVVLYVLGLFVMAFGVAFAIASDLGTSPVNSLPYVLSLATGIELGTCVVAIFAGFILIQVLILRREFKWINLTQILFSTLFGYFVDFAKAVTASFSIPTYAGRLLMLAVSIVLVATGVSLYVNARLVNMPMEGMIAAVTHKLPDRSFHQVKAVLDCAIVCVAVILSFLSMGGLFGVREGTVACALLAGPLMKPIQKVLVPIIEKVCFECSPAGLLPAEGEQA